jgi:DNA-binding CsgD family transcriptional regulator
MATTALGFRSDRITFEILEALAGATDVRELMTEVYPLLVRLVPADYGALGVSASGRLEDYEWTVADLPSGFFEAYAALAAHDFVRDSVVRLPNQVLRDQDMIQRTMLEKNPFYQRAREVGAPIEQVMAVMLHVDERWQGGLSLYRDRRRPFSAAERERLQRIAPALANSVRRCQLFDRARDFGSALDSLLSKQGGALIVAAASGIELARSSNASALLEEWVAPTEFSHAGLPAPLTSALGELARNPGNIACRRWSRGGCSSTLLVDFSELELGVGNARWILRLRAVPHVTTLPPDWNAQLTLREREIVGCVAQGWDNRLIATELRCAETTVKRHLQNVFDKLGVSSRTVLQARLSEWRLRMSNPFDDT